MESKKESSYSREEEHAKQSTGTTGMAGERQAAAGRGAGVGGSAGRPSKAAARSCCSPASTAERLAALPPLLLQAAWALA
jgi:hypothetical protein